MDTIAEQVRELGLASQPDETPQHAAERIWKETGKDPIETIKTFDHWAREDPDRMLAVLGPHWYRSVKVFLARNKSQPGAWRYSDSFRTMWRRLEMKGHSLAVWYSQQEVPLERGLKQSYARNYWRRKANGIKRVYADVDAATGKLVSLIDKEFGPFAHIRVNGCELAEVTTEEALRWCDRQDTDTRFVRALCCLIPDPRKPIGAQWTAETIAEAKRMVEQ